eukprot:SAG31_NODE_1033_length_10230_cov_15.289014_3_plen_152_part_00
MDAWGTVSQMASSCQLSTSGIRAWFWLVLCVGLLPAIYFAFVASGPGMMRVPKLRLLSSGSSWVVSESIPHMITTTSSRSARRSRPPKRWGATAAPFLSRAKYLRNVAPRRPHTQVHRLLHSASPSIQHTLEFVFIRSGQGRLERNWRKAA